MKYAKAIFLGILMWVIPFVTSFLFFDMNTKQLIIDEHVFKSIMLLESSVLGVILIVYFFRSIKFSFFKEGLILGLLWFVINCLLDVILLLPMSKMALPVWFGQIGVRYLMAPIMGGAMGYMADKMCSCKEGCEK